MYVKTMAILNTFICIKCQLLNTIKRKGMSARFLKPVYRVFNVAFVLMRRNEFMARHPGLRHNPLRQGFPIFFNALTFL